MPGITNPAEVYFKDGIWSWATSTWEKLVSSGGRLFTALHGWDGSAWRKLPLVFGYSGQYAEREAATDVSAGTVTMDFSKPLAGEIWVVQSIATYSHQASATSCFIAAWVAGVLVPLMYHANPGAYRSMEVVTPVILKYNDFIRCEWYSAAANDDFVAGAMGYKMKIAE